MLRPLAALSPMLLAPTRDSVCSLAFPSLTHLPEFVEAPLPSFLTLLVILESDNLSSAAHLKAAQFISVIPLVVSVLTLAPSQPDSPFPPWAARLVGPLLISLEVVAMPAHLPKSALLFYAAVAYSADSGSSDVKLFS